jgi:hypothetical protein
MTRPCRALHRRRWATTGGRPYGTATTWQTAATFRNPPPFPGRTLDKDGGRTYKRVGLLLARIVASYQFEDRNAACPYHEPVILDRQRVTLATVTTVSFRAPLYLLDMIGLLT